MLPVENKIGGVTIFTLPEKNNSGWEIKIIRDGKVLKTGYAFEKEDIERLRGKWIDSFWGKSLN